MSISTLLEPATETQTWSSLYANQLNVSTLVADGLKMQGNLDMNGYDIVNAFNYTGVGTMATGTLIVSGPMAGQIATFSGSVGCSSLTTSGSISSGGSISATTDISAGGSVSAAGQSLICFTSAPGSQSIPNNTLTPVTFLTNQITSKGSNITWNSGAGTLTFNANGYYSVSVQLSWAVFGAPANIVSYSLLDAGGGPYSHASQSTNTSSSPCLTGTIVRSFSAGEVLTLNVFQNSGAANFVGSGALDSFISAYQIVA